MPFCETCTTTIGFNLGNQGHPNLGLQMMIRAAPEPWRGGWVGEDGGRGGGEVAFFYTVPHLLTGSFLLHIPCCFGCFNLMCRSL